jgi:hypothetical protein
MAADLIGKEISGEKDSRDDQPAARPLGRRSLSAASAECSERVQ